ncbi:MAG: hypothetical protein CMO01_13095 [Thalassobius sp.]|nr:hypothetical protein [Thalassovita sp.]
MKKSLPSLLISILLFFVLFSCEEIDSDGDVSPSTDSEAYRLDGAFSADGGGSGSGNGDGEQQEAGVITAGEWNDLDNWSFWESLVEKDTFKNLYDYWGFYPENRYALTFSDKNLLPIVDATVKLYSDDEIIWEAKTDNYGKAELWAGLFSNQKSSTSKITIDYNNNSYDVENFDIFNGQRKQVVLPIQIQDNPNTVDLTFVVDATGSMGDELEYLKTELLDVINRIKSTDADLKLRMGTVFYRDEGDDYVTKVSNLSEDNNKAIDFIKAQSADGGGDYPEAVHSAMSDAIEQLSWSAEARTRIMFLILDAPPHHETPSVVTQIQELTEKAASKGIKIIPITASGIQKDTEFLMRFIAMVTNSTYVFITNDSGIGNDHIEATVGEYDVEYLNDLMVRLVSKYTL